MCSRRLLSTCDVYHVTSRGAGGQIIFEDKADNRHFLVLLKKACKDNEIKVAAWCLMGNHFHLLLNAPIERVSKAMMQLKRIYSRDTNIRYGRTGHLFQGRFSSFPINDDSYFAAAIRYIHNNPVRAGIVAHPSEYQWSSYQEYLGKRFLLDDALMLDIGASNSNCLDFNDEGSFDKAVLYRSSRLSDEEASLAIKEQLGISSPTLIKGLAKADRDKAIDAIAELDIPQAQIARLTGISQSTVSRACNANKKS